MPLTLKPTTQRKYDAAFRAEALRLAGESRSPQAAARALSINPKLLYKWQKEAQTPMGAALGASLDPATAAEPVAGPFALAGAGTGDFKKSHRQRLLHAQALSDAGPMNRYRFIQAQQGCYPVRGLCRALGMAPSRYYAWKTVLVALFERPKSRYGTRRLRAALREKSYRVGRQALRTSLARRGLRAMQPKAYTPRTTDSTHGLRCVPNRLLDEPRPPQANRVWASDIT